MIYRPNHAEHDDIFEPEKSLLDEDPIIYGPLHVPMIDLMKQLGVAVINSGRENRDLFGAAAANVARPTSKKTGLHELDVDFLFHWYFSWLKGAVTRTAPGCILSVFRCR